MEADYQENYHKAREVIAQELIDKYGFVESYRDDYRLTLDSESHSFHLIFEAPEGRRLNVTEKGSLPKTGYSYLGYVFDYVNGDLKEAEKVLLNYAKSYKKVKEEDYFKVPTMVANFRCELEFLKDKYNYLFY